MKKTAGILLLLLINLSSFAKINKGDILLQFQGSYLKSPSEIGTTSNNINSVTNQLNLVGAVEYMFSNNLSAGVGLNYFHKKDDKNSAVALYGNSSVFYQIENLKLKENTFLPQILLSYHYEIIKGLYISPSIGFSYGKAKVEYDTEIFYASASTSSIQNSAGSITKKEESDIELASVAISPVLNYFFNERFGLSLSIGLIEYGLVDWETENSLIVADFSATSWKFGFNFRF